MNKLKQGYYYIFYKFYKMSEAAPSKWWSEWKAAIAIMALEIWFVLSLGSYISVITKKTMVLTLTNPIVFIPFSIILALNYFSFMHNDKWKKYVEEFDQLPKRTNKTGGWIVFGIVLFVIANLIFSIFLLNRIDWSIYK